jgi:hypothetical protein
MSLIDVHLGWGSLHVAHSAILRKKSVSLERKSKLSMSRFYQTAEARDTFWRAQGYEWGVLVGSELSGFDAFEVAISYPRALERVLQEEEDPDLARELFIDGFDQARAEQRS